VSSQASGTSFAVTMPTHQAGDLLIAVVGFARSSNNLTASAGWSTVVSVSTGAFPCFFVFTKVAASSAETLTVTNNDNGQITAHVYAFSSGVTPEGTVSSVSADPPSYTASWGIDANLFMCGACSNSTTGSNPTGYAGTATSTQINARLYSGLKASSSATDDPSTTGAAGSPDSFTIVISPS
jgi:hypothetical protein